MKAADTELTKLLGIDAQFFVPLYQRKYSWMKKHCERLYDDIIKIAHDIERPSHFIGSIMYLPKSDSQHASAAKEYLIIDGQQRLTTISLLLLALADYSKEYYSNQEDYEKSETNFERLSNKYLFNQYESDSMRYKVRLNDEDFCVYKKLLSSRNDLSECKNHAIYINYKYLLDKMKTCKQHPQEVFNGIKKLVLVDICLVQGDNAQLIFETVNSTGLPLSSSDKIRNFLLMTLTPTDQSKLYIEKWHPMEKLLGLDTGNKSRFDDFFAYYLTISIKRELRGDHYELFKDYYYSIKDKDTFNIVNEIYEYAKIYKEWKESKNEVDSLGRKLSRIAEIGQFKITPAIMKLIKDYKDGVVKFDDLYAILEIIESYFMRRTILNFPSNTAGAVCLSMLTCLKEKEDYLKNFTDNLKARTYAQRMPTDIDLLNNLVTLSIYRINSKRTKNLLDNIENYNCKEYVPTKEYTIEHIMPQTLSDEWREDLGENADDIYNKYLHTIGNLTLSGYNTEYRNYRFLKKRDMENGYRQTPIRISRSLANIEEWNEPQIVNRAKELIGIIMNIWKYPNL